MVISFLNEKNPKPTTMKMAMKMCMKKMAMKKSVIAMGKLAKVSVFKGTKLKTVGGLKKGDLIKSKSGKIVSKKASLRAKNSKSGKKILKWAAAFKQARKDLKIKGFVPCKKGSALYKATMAIYKK